MTEHTTTGSGFDRGSTTSDPDVTSEIGDDESPSTAVVRATAAATGRSVLDLEPLYRVVDPQHLDEVVEGAADASVTLEFGGCTVTVTGEEVEVEVETVGE